MKTIKIEAVVMVPDPHPGIISALEQSIRTQLYLMKHPGGVQSIVSVKATLVEEPASA